MGRSRKKQPGESLSDNELRRYVILLIIFCVVLILIAVVLISGKNRNAAPETADTAASEVQTEENSNIPVIEPDTKEYFQDFGGSILELDTVPEITQLMEQYFLSITECDMDTFMHLFTSEDTSQTETFRQHFEKQKQYVEGYQNISCYTTKGLDENSYVAYVYYDKKFVGVDTLGPALVQIYAVKCEDGVYRIYDQEISPELETYLEQVSQNEDVRLLIKQVDRQLADAMEADEALKARIMFLKEGPDYMHGESQPEEISGENPEASEQNTAENPMEMME